MSFSTTFFSLVVVGVILASAAPKPVTASAPPLPSNSHLDLHFRPNFEVNTVTASASASASATTRVTLCPRVTPGSEIPETPQLFSSNGVLQLSMTFHTTPDANGNPKYCYMLANGGQSPTLYVKPGDRLALTLSNEVNSSSVRSLPLSHNATQCGDTTVDATSTNIHFHGLAVPPTCNKDDVLHTVINSGESFTYNFVIPVGTSPGAYWYHPHIHGMADMTVLGGASGALIIQGIQDIQPAVAGLPERVFVVRDTLLSESSMQENDCPAWDLSINYVEVPFPHYTPGVITMKPQQKQFWRLINACADSLLQVQVLYDGVPQVLEIVALDGSATRSPQGTAQLLQKTSVLLTTAQRVEFIITAPCSSVKNATLVTSNVNTGPDGDNDPPRALARIQVSPNAPNPCVTIPAARVNTPVTLPSISNAAPVRTRTLYFSEVISNPDDPNSPTNFYITEDGHTPVMFTMNVAPAITAVQGTVEDWIIQNRAAENHEFHIHQVHFKVLERNGVAVPADEQQYHDTVDVPYWGGQGKAYPSVKIRMDFESIDVGEFVYHCHILGHEDNGMMAKIQVVPAA